MQSAAPSRRTQLQRGQARAAYASEDVRAILQEGFICHVAITIDGNPVVIPMAYGLRNGELLLHGSTANRVLRALNRGQEACVMVMLLDGLVLARSAFHHSVNYRSVVLYASAREVDDAAEKLEALEAIVEHIVPNRWKDVRGPNLTEFQRTLVMALPIDEASAKIRSGPPVDDEEDYEMGCWAGVLPLLAVPGEPINDPRLAAGALVPDYLTRYARPQSSAGGPS